MVIHINQQDRTTFPGETTGDLPTIFDNRKSKPTTAVSQSLQNAASLGLGVLNNYQSSDIASRGVDIASELLNKVPELRSAEAFIKGAAGQGFDFLVDSLQRLQSGKFTRTISRTTDTIALYMPDTLTFSNQQDYSGVGMASVGTLAAGFEVGQSMVDKILKGDVSGAGKSLGNLSPFIAAKGLESLLGNAGTALFAGATGTVLNPQLELIYSSPSFRQFEFEFMFYPRSEQEALEVQNILERLRFHQAPEILKGPVGGFFLVPPSEFDIKFYYNGSENPNITPISTCVLTRIGVDYAPSGFAAYEKPTQDRPVLGGTGMPVAIRLNLSFTETEILTKDNYRYGGLGGFNLEGNARASQAGEFGST
jgi:hypothetical protein